MKMSHQKKFPLDFFRSTLSLGPVHPWQFVEEAACKEVEKDFNSVYSRLVLCKTFRLNEDGKVLLPEELLYRCVEAVNFTHNPQHAQMDVKLRSLICMGLNEQVYTAPMINVVDKFETCQTISASKGKKFENL